MSEAQAIQALAGLPQPVGIHGGSYTYWVDVTKQPLRFRSSDGFELTEPTTLAGIERWMDSGYVSEWRQFLDGELDLEFMLGAGMVRAWGGRGDQPDHEGQR